MGITKGTKVRIEATWTFEGVTHTTQSERIFTVDHINEDGSVRVLYPGGTVGYAHISKISE